jgi:hypothetical protein
MAAMRKLVAWLGAATLLTVWSVAVSAAPTALKPYIVLILDTSGSMTQATGSGPPSCPSATGGLLADTKLNHAKCAIYDISNSYGGMVLALGRFRNKMSGTYPTCCSPGPAVGAGGGCPAGVTCTNDSNMTEMLTGLVDGTNSQVSVWVDGTQNTCTSSGTDPEIWNADSSTPLEGSLNGAKCYWSGLQESTTATTCVASGGTVVWPSTSPGFNPIVNDPLATQFLPAGCDPSPTCTTNCCATQCRPYITIILTDGDETCGGTPLTGASNLFNTDVTVGGITRRYHVVTDPIGFGTPVPYQPIEDMAHGGGHPDLAGNEGFYASDQASLELAMTQIIESSLRSESCNNLDDDCDNAIDEDFPGKGNACDNGQLGVCKGTGTLGCRADGTGLQCNITNPGGSAQTSCPPGKTCSPDGTETCNDGLDNDCDGAIDEGCAVCVPTTEICNNKDDDCNGLVDDGIPPRQCSNVPGASCSPNPACCGTQTCVGGAYTACSATVPNPPPAETCNNKDDDCDGIVDEDLTKSCSMITGNGCATPPCPGTNNPGDPSHSPIPQNICHPGQQTCSAGAFGTCQNEQTPQPEICNGLDDDCDNKIDEDTGGGSCNANCGVGTIVCAGSPQDPNAANCCQPGSCSAGQVQCATLYCTAQPTTGDYTCDQKDDDCDNKVDEDWVCSDPTGNSTPAVPCACTGAGICNGQNKCINGQVVCQGTPVDPSSCCDCSGHPQNGLCTGGSSCASDCKCAFPCAGGEFPCPAGEKCDANNFCIKDPCYMHDCPDMNGKKQVCVDQNHVGVCVDACSTVTCAPSEVCIDTTGECKPNDCTTFPSKCTTCQQCQVDQNGAGQCITDACCMINCPTDQYCEGGQCLASCAGVNCKTGERCRLGQCEPDPCGHPCPFGEVCDETLKICKQDTCQVGNRPCPQGQACDPQDGQCKPDPCLGVTCPGSGQVCRQGTCYDAGSLQPDGGAGAHVTVGGGGCSTSGGGAGLLIALALLLVRRRSQGGDS